MKIAMVLPPLPFLDDPLRNAPLGPLYVAAALEREEAKVVVLDHRDGDEQVRVRADAYAWTATTLEYPAAVRMARKVKEKYPNAVRILGGVHASVLPAQEIDPVFDIVAPGEGEPMAESLLLAIQAHLGIRVIGVPGRISDVDALPWPARHLLRRSRWISWDLVEPGIPATTIIGSRGCPYNCSFCAASMLYQRRVRWRSVDLIADEIGHLAEQGVRGLRFHDDCFAVEKDRLRQMCDILGASDMVWRVNIRATAMDAEIADMMALTGCREVGIGVESAHQPTLDIVNKGMTVEAAEEAIRVAKEAGLRVRAFMMIGLPRDITATKTIAFLERTRPTKVVVSSFVPFPGSAIYQDPSAYGLRYIDPDITRHRMFVGLGEDEPFRYEYEDISASTLEYNRTWILSWLRQEGMG